jgi:uncharacterized protein YndB with AHSA1/START domain
MSRDTSSTFVYVSFIRTTQEKLWHALTDSEFMDQYWLGARFRADWKVGGAWSITYPDGSVTDRGEVLEYDPPRRIVLRWRNEIRPELNAEGYAQCVFEIDKAGEIAKLRVTHSIEVPESKLIEAVSGGWPLILSNLKSLIESGTVCVESKASLQ